jgi:hypothetical protein
VLTNATVSYLPGVPSDGDVGALLGLDLGGTVSSSSSSGNVTGGSGNASVMSDGGLIGGAVNNSMIQNSSSSANVSGATGSSAGGLIGVTFAGGATIFGSYATGTVMAGAGSFIGGLVGYSGGGSITQSFSIGTVSGGANSQIGGLVGHNVGNIADSYAMGSVIGGSADNVGGLVGSNVGTISQSYAMGAVSAQDAASNVGGLVGLNASPGTVDQSYSTGYVTALAGSAIGGLIGDNTNTAGSITNDYYDTLTSGAANAIGTGTLSAGAVGETTTALQAALPAGFASGWAIVAGTSYPYLSWEFPSGTPQVVSGIVYSDSGVTPVGPGDVVNLLVNGNNPVTLTGSNLTVTGANGYYYFLMAPGTIPATNGQVVAYTKGTGGGEGVADNANGSATGLPIWANTIWLTTPDAFSSQVSTDLNTGWGNSPDRNYLSNMPNVYGISTGPNFTFDDILKFAGTATFIVNGPLTIASTGGFMSGAGGNAVTLVAPSFINQAGSGAINITGGGRWLIFTNNPGADTFDNLNSNNTAVWDTTYPTAVAAAGDRYVFAFQPTIVVTSGNLAKTTGTDETAAVAADFTITGLEAGVTGAFLPDSAAAVYSGTPSVTSAGSPPSAPTSGSPYAITVSQGTLAVMDGYALDLASTGLLTVNPSPVTTTPVLATFVATPPSTTTVSTPPVAPPPALDLTGATSLPSGSEVAVETSGPLESMTTESGGSDTSDVPESQPAANDLGHSLDPHSGQHTTSVVIAGLLNQEMRTAQGTSANGVVSADQVYSSEGNVTLWPLQ